MQRPLEEKTELARALLARLAQEHGPQRVGVAWTGGKDSTVALDLWREVLARVAPGEPLRAVSVDTGVKFPEVVALRDEWAARWGLELTVARPAVELAGYPVARDPVACCRDLKIRPLMRALADGQLDVLITGLRADEHPDREGRALVEERTDPESGLAYLQANPILDFTEMDVWACLTSRGLPFVSLYAEGYRSLGCVPCTRKSHTTERSGRWAAKEARMAELKSLGYF